MFNHFSLYFVSFYFCSRGIFSNSLVGRENEIKQQKNLFDFVKSKNNCFCGIRSSCFLNGEMWLSGWVATALIVFIVPQSYLSFVFMFINFFSNAGVCIQADMAVSSNDFTVL